MVNIVHYDEISEEKKESFRKTILDKKMPGIALDNGIALEVIDDSVRIIKAIKDAKAYFVRQTTFNLAFFTASSSSLILQS